MMKNELLNKSGFLCINKPTGMTSYEIVSLAKKKLNIRKIGHLGTIDKAGAGVLPLAVGLATKFFDYFLSKDKVYLALFKFGAETDTLDSYGTIVNRSDKLVTFSMLENSSKKFIGEIMQVPPKFSAVKISGKRASDLTQKGIDIKLKPRLVKIYNFEVLKEIKENLFLVLIHCSSGTYIRSIMRDIAQDLGTFGTMVGIIRTRSGPFCLDDAILIDDISWENLIPLENIVGKQEIKEKFKDVF